MKHPKHLREVIQYFGGIPQLCAALKIKNRSAVYQWGGKIPELRALQLEKITNGHFSADKLLAGKRAGSKAA